MTAHVLLDGSAELDRETVGGKAWSVNRLRQLGLPVPPAFTLPTALCRQTLAGGGLPAEALVSLDAGIAHLEATLDRGFGASERPLFVSVRSGAARSMPGMMDTVLNVGAAERTLAALAREAGPELAEDIRSRFGVQFQRIVGMPPPESPREQLRAATEAVFRSWNSPRARTYRRHHGWADDADNAGTAVTVQAMVFGNGGAGSGTGVLFTRNPHSGTADLYGEWLPNAQGEDVVSGQLDPQPLSALAAQLPDLHAELVAAARRLERDAGDVQDIEFTIEHGRLWLLQTRAAKRSPVAAVRLAVLLAREGLITPRQALERITPGDMAAIRQPTIDPGVLAGATVLARGEPASPGIGTGVVVTSSDEAEDRADSGEAVVLATATTNPDDIHGMAAATAVVTELGGTTSHAAVVSRELGRVCVVGCGAGNLIGLAGSTVTVDGTSGRIYAGLLPAVAPTAHDGDVDIVAGWLATYPAPELAAALAGTR